MEKYITIPSPLTGRPNVLVPVSNINRIGMNGINSISIKFCNKANNMDISITSPTAVATGTTTTFNTGKVLIDSTATFITDGIKPGDFVVRANAVADIAQVVSVDSETQLTLNRIIYRQNSSEAYSVYTDIDAPAKFIQDAMLEALQSQWIDPIYEITDVPFTITSISY